MTDTSPSSTLSAFLDQSIIGMAAREASDIYFFPLETAMFSSLVIASHAVGSAYSVSVPGKARMPIPLFGISEQPSNSGKTGLVEDLYSGYTDEATILNRDIQKEAQTMKQAIAAKIKAQQEVPDEETEMLEKLSFIPIGVSDATPEGLETSLVETSGFFIAYSTEQGLSKTLLGGLYNDGKAKDDILLKGFNGEAHSVHRANKEVKRFSGRPYGGMFELSQQGTIARIMASAGSTGISERFLMHQEGDLLGKRKYIQTSDDELNKLLVGDLKPNKSMLAAAKPKSRKALDQYRRQMSHFPHVRKSLDDKSIRGLIDLKIQDDAYVLLLAAKQQVENWIGSQPYRNNYLASMKGKIDLQMMKVAATLHCMDWDVATHGKIGNVISADTVREAYWIVFELFRGVTEIASGNALYGDDVEDEFVLDYISTQRTMISADKICHNVARQKETPFRFYQKRGEARSKIKASIERLAEEGKISQAGGVKRLYGRVM